MKYVAMAALFIGAGIFAKDFFDRTVGAGMFQPFEAAVCFLVIACAIPLIWSEPTKQ